MFSFNKQILGLQYFPPFLLKRYKTFVYRWLCAHFFIHKSDDIEIRQIWRIDWCANCGDSFRINCSPAFFCTGYGEFKMVFLIRFLNISHEEVEKLKIYIYKIYTVYNIYIYNIYREMFCLSTKLDFKFLELQLVMYRISSNERRYWHEFID